MPGMNHFYQNIHTLGALVLCEMCYMYHVDHVDTDFSHFGENKAGYFM